MGCACKNSNIKHFEKMSINNRKSYEKKGIIGLLSGLTASFINKLVLVILLIILTPIVIIVILCNLFIKDKLEFTVPKFITDYMKKNKDE